MELKPFIEWSLEDDVPGARLDGGQEFGARLGDAGLDLKAVARQLEADQLDVVG